MKHTLDFTDVQCAFGAHTSYYAGTLRIDGVPIVVDGITDRSSWGIAELTARQCLVNEGLAVPEDSLCPWDYPDDSIDKLIDLCLDAEAKAMEIVGHSHGGVVEIEIH